MLASQSLFPSFFLSFSLCTRYGTSCKVPLGRRKDALNLCKHISRALFWVFTNFKVIFCLGENMSFLGKSLCSLHSVSFPFCGRASPVCSLSFPFSFLFHGTRALGTRSARRQQLWNAGARRKEGNTFFPRSSTRARRGLFDVFPTLSGMSGAIYKLSFSRCCHLHAFGNRPPFEHLKSRRFLWG